MRFKNVFSMTKTTAFFPLFLRMYTSFYSSLVINYTFENDIKDLEPGTKNWSLPSQWNYMKL